MTLPGLVRANNLNDVVDRERAWDNLGSSLATGDISIPAPSLDLNFAANKSLVDNVSGQNLITFSRASTGTFIDSNGLIQAAASGVPRFDHNPATKESLGLLIEEARANNEPNSNSFTWSPGNPKISSSATVDPFLGTNAKRLTPTTANEVHGWQRYMVYGTGNYAFSMFVKPAGYSRISIGCNNANANDFTVNLNGSGSYTTGNAITFPTGLVKLTDGWFRLTWQWNNGGGGGANNTFPYCIVLDNSGQSTFAGDGTSGVDFYGFQVEGGAFSTSYIPTSGSTVTRAADVASITGANFSSWYNSTAGTWFGQVSRAYATTQRLFEVGDSSSNQSSVSVRPGPTSTSFARQASGANTVSHSYPAKFAVADSVADIQGCVNGTLAGLITTGTSVTDNKLVLGGQISGTSSANAIARLTYWPSRLNNIILQYITQPSINSFNLYAFNYAINGKDVLALNAVRNASTRNFIFIKGLLSAAQPRLTTAAASTSSALTLATNALPKLSPTSSGNYFFASGLALSGVTTRINGTNALSIATSPFSGSTATAPLLFRELRPQANWRFTEPMPSGTIASPEFAIPFETNDFVLFMKAGQN